MNERDALDIVQAAIWTIIVASGPTVGAAMLVGTAIALIQALTQVQEVTLTFVPKIIVILLVVAVSGSYIMNSLTTFARESGRELRVRAYVTFLVSQVAGLLANTTTVFIASYFMPVLLGKVLAIGASFLVNFSLSHFIVFRKRGI